MVDMPLKDEQAIWDAYNLLLLGPDVERLRKLFARYDLFRMTLTVPGDSVDCGVFIGAGLMLWLKLLKIHMPGSINRVVGFDTFNTFAASETAQEAQQVRAFVAETGFEGVTPGVLLKWVEQAGLDPNKCELVEGDIRQTAAAYCEDKPGFRVSLLHLDLDLDAATHAALAAFWPRMPSGGVIVLDNYGEAGWSEAQGVDRFFQDQSIQIKTLTYSRTPTAYIVKK
jgi:hypothetical protein